MKAKREGETLVKVGYRLPPDLIKRLEQSAIANRRSVNDELIVILESVLISEQGGSISNEALYRLLKLKFDSQDEQNASLPGRPRKSKPEK